MLVDERTRTVFRPESPVGFGRGHALQLKGKASTVQAFEASLSERPSRGQSAAHTGVFVGRSGEIRDLVSLLDVAADALAVALQDGRWHHVDSYAPKRAGQRFLSVRATLRGKRLKVKGRAITADAASRMICVDR